jgi:hypothetical protein
VTTQVTYGSALDAINALVDEFASNAPLSASHAEVVAFAVNHDLQVRDYFLGLPQTLTAQGAVKFITDLLPLVAEADRVPFYTVLSAYYFEAGDNDLAHASLFSAQALNPDYSLAQLLGRVFSAGWVPEAFASMRDELHPKVVATLTENRELVIS